MGDIFREIDEELKQEHYARLWQKYGKYVIAGVVGIAVVAAGIAGWRYYIKHERLDASDRFASALALAADGKTSDAATAFAEVVQQAGGTYQTLARLQEAAMQARTGDAAGAVALYQKVADDGDVRRELRQLAALLSVLHGIDLPDADRAAMSRRLEPLATADSPWRHSARELLALLAFKAGDQDKARTLYRQVADDLGAPAAVRARAAEMLAVLGK